MNVNTLTGAGLAAAISFFNALLALFMNNSELTFAVITQAAWVSMIVGAILQFLKDYQAISTRRVINKFTKSGDGGGII